nr:HutD family protein [Bacteriovorax sp. HI3]
MIEIFTKDSFKEMPWKNGGGSTLELYRMPSEGDFNFRLSMATVSSDGPFSHFPGIDRILLLMEGAGFRLNKKPQSLTMDTPFSPLTFSGEEDIHCQLIQGTCRDFNIMTRRDFAKSSLSIVDRDGKNPLKIKALCPLKFIYDTHAQTLTKMNQGDESEFKGSIPTRLLIIDVNLV